MQLGARVAPAAHDAISSGSLGLDLALGVGGFPRGRVIEVFGPESSGKTTLALHVIAEAQKRGMSAVFIDAEHALDPKCECEARPLAALAASRVCCCCCSSAGPLGTALR